MGRGHHLVVCSRHGGKISKGTNQVYRFVLFHFCWRCWWENREDCNRIMQQIAGCILLLLALLASSQATTVTGTLEDIGQNTVPGWALRITVRGCTPTSGQSYFVRNSSDGSIAILPQAPIFPNAAGAISFTVPDETTLACGSTATTIWYHIDAVHINQVNHMVDQLGPGNDYDITGASVNLATLTPRNAPAVASTPNAVITNPSGTQTVTQPDAGHPLIVNFLQVGSCTGCGTGGGGGFYQTVEKAGVAQTQRSVLNFLSPFLAADNVSNGSTDVSIPNATGTQTGLLTSTDWTTFNGKQNALPLSTLGDLLYENATPSPARLAGNTSSTKQFLTQTGTGTVSAAPAWGVLASADIPNNAANTTGNAATATALASVPTQCSGNNWATGIAASGNANCAQVGFGNLSGSVAIGQTPLTTLGDLMYANATPALARLAGSTSATKQFLTQTGNGTISAAPAWGTLASADIPNNAANTTGNAATATALASTPTQCSGNNWATGIAASGNANCAQVGFTNLSGSVGLGQTPLTTLGDLLIVNSTPALARLAGQTTTTKEYLSQTGTGTVSAAPAWSQIAYGDLSGTPTLEYQTVKQDGTSQTQRPTINLISGPNATVSCADNAGLLRTDCTISASASSGMTNPMTTLGDIIYENSTPAPARLAGSTSATKNFLTQTGNGTISAAPAWGTLASADIPNNAANTTGNAATATALASTPTQCSGNNWATGVAASGNANCAQVGFSNLSGSVALGQTPLTTLGDILYVNSTPALARLAGSTSATKQFLTQTGNGTVSAAPAWGTLACGDLPAETGDVTTSGCAATIANNAVTAAKSAVVMQRRTCAIIIGADNASSALANADIAPQGRQCFIPYAATVVEVEVAADAGTPNVIVAKNHAGTLTDLLSAALATAASGGIACSNTGGTAGLDGATTCSATLQNTSLAAGDYIDTHTATAGGTAKRMSIFVTFTVN